MTFRFMFVEENPVSYTAKYFEKLLCWTQPSATTRWLY